jgi:phosphopantetheinyl transferase (holo-ACP synthase)
MRVEGELNEGILKDLGVTNIHSSLAHEDDYAIAFVTLEGNII